MPQLTVLTNVTRENVPKNFTQRATQIMVAEIKKDAKYMSVCVVPDCIMSFGGTSDPCAQVTLSSIGNLGLEENKRISKSLSELLESALGLMPTRYYIHFRDDSRENTGYNGSTFAK
jgi:phenylpyruvate tautomerase